MARGVPRPDEPQSLDELLRQAGAKPRHRAQPRTLDEPDPVSDPDEHRDRLERQAREAAYPQQHAGLVFRRIALVSALLAALGGLLVISMTSESRPLSQGTLSGPQLQPATASPTASSTPAPTSSITSAVPTTAGTPTATSTPSAKPAPPPAKKPITQAERHAACTVRYVIEDQWPTGFRTTVTITNTGGTQISPWSLSWTYTAGQQVQRGWDGQYSQSGNRVTVMAASCNAAIAPGAAVSTGFTASLSGSNPAPTAYTLNGGSCTLG